MKGVLVHRVAGCTTSGVGVNAPAEEATGVYRSTSLIRNSPPLGPYILVCTGTPDWCVQGLSPSCGGVHQVEAGGCGVWVLMHQQRKRLVCTGTPDWCVQDLSPSCRTVVSSESVNKQVSK